MTQTEYDFADLASVLKAISDLPEDDKAEFNRRMNQVKTAADRFLKTRKNSELMDMADEVVHIEGDEVSIYDYMGSFLEWFLDWLWKRLVMETTSWRTRRTSRRTTQPAFGRGTYCY